jgi:quinol monooxygenase YgiN
MIRHAALFALHHAQGSAAEADFLKALRGLAAIPGVQAFQIARETSPKNPYAFAVSMEFTDQAAYDAYNIHPLHLAFVQTRWTPEVAAFMEHDTVALSAP